MREPMTVAERSRSDQIQDEIRWWELQREHSKTPVGKEGASHRIEKLSAEWRKL